MLLRIGMKLVKSFSPNAEVRAPMNMEIYI